MLSFRLFYKLAILFVAIVSLINFSLLPQTAFAQTNSNFNEPQVRYIMADIQLGNVYNYYQLLALSDPINAPGIYEALTRWDNGVRVINISDFERILVSSWIIVYRGTQTQIEGMDVILTTDAGSISGHVYDATNNTPIDNQVIYALPVGGGNWYAGITDSNGYYLISDLPNDGYKLVSDNPYNPCRPSGPCQYSRQYYTGNPGGALWGDDELVKVITIDASNKKYEADFYLQPGMTISGRILDPQGNPIPNLSVAILNQYYWRPFCTDADGRYVFGGLLPSPEINTIKVGQAEPWCSGRSIGLSEDFQLTSDISKDFIVGRGGDIQVMVQDPEGNPVEDAWVEIYNYDTGEDYASMVPQMFSVSNPFPRIRTVPAGNTSIYVDAPKGFISQYYNYAYTLKSSMPVTITEGNLTSVVITLDRASNFRVEWLPPLKNMTSGEIYQMVDGSTLPIKFYIKDPRGIPIYNPNVALFIYTMPSGYETGEYVLFTSEKGEVRQSEIDRQYTANLHTKQYPWMTAGQNYAIEVFYIEPVSLNNENRYTQLGTYYIDLIQGGKAKKD